jgi:hypothetical protein
MHSGKIHFDIRVDLEQAILQSHWTAKLGRLKFSQRLMTPEFAQLRRIWRYLLQQIFGRL